MCISEVVTCMETCPIDTFLVLGGSPVHFWCWMEVLCISGVGWKSCAFLVLGECTVHFLVLGRSHVHFWCWMEVLYISGVGRKSCAFLVLGRMSCTFSGVGRKSCTFLTFGGSPVHFWC